MNPLRGIPCHARTWQQAACKNYANHRIYDDGHPLYLCTTHFRQYLAHTTNYDRSTLLKRWHL